MSFDDLFALLLFIVFIGLPLLNRMQQRGRRGAPPGAPPSGRPRPSAPTQSRTPRAGPAGGAAAGEREARSGEERASQERAAPSAQSTTDTGRQRREGDPFAELAERLEEARRRVREASGAGTSASQTSSQTSSQPADQAARPLVAQSTAPTPRRTVATPAPPSQPIPDARAGQPRRPRAARDPFPKGRERPSAPWNQSTSQRRTSLSDDAPALEVERPARSRLSSGSERRAREVARLRAKDLVALDSSSFRKGMLWHLVLSDPVGYRNRRKPSPPASR